MKTWIDLDKRWDLWRCVGDNREWNCEQLFNLGVVLSTVALAVILSALLMWFTRDRPPKW